MSTKVISLQEKMDSKQPHIVIQCDTNRVHVYWKDITRAIIKEWLHLIKDGRHE